MTGGLSAFDLVIFDWAGTMVDFGCRAPIAALIEAFGRRAPPVLERWTGTYASAPDSTVVDTPAPGVRLVMVTTGAGASTGFALGEEVVADLFGETGQ